MRRSGKRDSQPLPACQMAEECSDSESELFNTACDLYGGAGSHAQSTAPSPATAFHAGIDPRLLLRSSRRRRQRRCAARDTRISPRAVSSPVQQCTRTSTSSNAVEAEGCDVPGVSADESTSAIRNELADVLRALRSARDDAHEASQTCSSLASEIRRLSDTASEMRAAMQLALDASRNVDGSAHHDAERGGSRAADVVCVQCHHLAADADTRRLSVMPQLSEAACIGTW